MGVHCNCKLDSCVSFCQNYVKLLSPWSALKGETSPSLPRTQMKKLKKIEKVLKKDKNIRKDKKKNN